MNTYNTLKKLNIITFLEIMQDGNTKLLDQEYTEDKQYTEEHINQINDIWLALYDKYYELKNDSFAKSYLSNQYKLFNLEFKVLILSKQHNILANLQELKESEEKTQIKQQCIEVIKEIEPRIKLNIFDSPIEVCVKLHSVLKALNNELGTIKVNQYKRTEKTKENVYKSISRVEQVLERSIGNTKEISVMQFLAYESDANEIIKIKEIKNKK